MLLTCSSHGNQWAFIISFYCGYCISIRDSPKYIQITLKCNKYLLKHDISVGHSSCRESFFESVQYEELFERTDSNKWVGLRKPGVGAAWWLKSHTTPGWTWREEPSRADNQVQCAQPLTSAKEQNKDVCVNRDQTMSYQGKKNIPKITVSSCIYIHIWMHIFFQSGFDLNVCNKSCRGVNVRLQACPRMWVKLIVRNWDWFQFRCVFFGRNHIPSAIKCLNNYAAKMTPWLCFYHYTDSYSLFRIL